MWEYQLIVETNDMSLGDYDEGGVVFALFLLYNLRGLYRAAQHRHRSNMRNNGDPFADFALIRCGNPSG